MAIPFLTSIDLAQNQLVNTRLENLATDPGTATIGRVYYNTTDDVVKFYDGTAWRVVTDAWISDVVGTAPIVANVAGGIATISINAATQSNPGSMSAADKTKLDSATSSNTATTIVMRDATGNFTAGTITADLLGNASTATNADQLDGQEGTWYQDRANHTGTQVASTISDLKSVVTTYRLDEFAAPNTNVSMGANKLINVADPTNPQDAATKAYVDASRAGLDVKESARVASTANIALATGGLLTIDGITVAAGDRVLVKNQTTASENGIYVAAAGAWSRATDADTDAEVTSGMFTFVSEGTTHADSGWVLTTDDPITLGTTALNFAQFSGTGAITAGDGLTQAGSTFNVGAGTGISVDATTVNISATYAGQTSITTVGTVTNGTWNASPVGVAYGGTGATDAAGARTNLGATGKFSANVGDGAQTSYTLTHNFNTRDVTVLVRESASPYQQVFCDVEMATTSSVTLRFTVAPTSNEYRVVVVG